ncbi:GntR family transcriptional regulator [Vibrio sp. SCSIO 43140]|uniref:GntR family transcriptional regulator n=1 Tax=Vibrio sp. SCSIO 43140 TaxID=2819100 RepID=UPI0020753C84|nr:GntR family transcriptional regulator [Vibrio sp. SCSIO 43140]USD62463.1 GntR family transcriptional regulator [Vibrio sp. SCSIO 43140]
MTQEKKSNQSRSEVAYQKLLQAIRHGELTPGTRVREIEVAEMLGISRTPVRDAIRRLESDGLLIHLPRQGAVIKQLDQKEVIELYEVREVLEGTAARYAARHASEIELAELEDFNDIMLSNAKDPIKVAEANRLFHQALYRAGNNRYLIDALNSLSNALTLLGGTTLQEGERTQTAYQEHQAIIDAIRQRDGDKAEQAARHHIQQAHRIRMRMQRASRVEVSG